MLTGSGGSIASRFSYDAYGNTLGQTLGASLLPPTALLYSGEQFDSDLGQYYLRARYYDPSNGRFNRIDPFAGSSFDPQSLHKYAYAHNDPVDRVDPSGLLTLIEIQTVVTEQVEFALQIITRLLQLKNRIENVLDFFNFLKTVFVLMQDPAGLLAMAQSAISDLDFQEIAKNFTEEALERAFNSLQSNFAKIVANVVKNNAADLRTAFSVEKPRSALIIYLPTPPGIGSYGPVLIPLGIKLGGKKAKRPLMLFWHKASGQGGRLLGTGVVQDTHHPSTTHVQFFRMDYHPFDNASDAWDDPVYGFHYHTPGKVPF